MLFELIEYWKFSKDVTILQNVKDSLKTLQKVFQDGFAKELHLTFDL